MKRVLALALAGAMLTASSAFAGSIGAEQQKPVTPCAAAADVVGRFRDGDLRARECAINAMRHDLLTVPADPKIDVEYRTYREQAEHLIGYYERRAQRQQTFLDGGSLITLIGAAGAFQGNITQQAREAWAVAAFTPSIISQFNVYEPTRELFHGGALAVQLITRRYERMFEALDVLQALPPDVPGCAPYSSLVSEITLARQAARAPVVYDPEGVLLGEARRINDACFALAARRDTIRTVAGIAKDRRARLGRDYAWDLLTLDSALVAKDQQMRTTPLQTLTALVSSPLRAVDFAITGENAQNGLNALKTQVAFAGMNRSLMSLGLPGLPAQGAVGPIAPLSERAFALDTASAPTNLRNHIGRLRVLGSALEVAQFEQSYHERAASVLTQAVNSDQLTFTYDATTNTTVVMVAPRQAEAGAIASGSTGQPAPGGGG